MSQGNYVNIGQNVQCTTLLCAAIEGQPAVNLGAVVGTSLTIASGGAVITGGARVNGNIGVNIGPIGGADILVFDASNDSTIEMIANTNSNQGFLHWSDSGQSLALSIATATSDDLKVTSTGVTVKNGLQVNGIANLGSFTRVTGADFTTASTSGVNVTGLTAALLANATYQFTAMLSINSSTVAGMSAGMNYSAAGATLESQLQGTTGAGQAAAFRQAAFGVTSGFATNGADGGVEINGIVVVGANAGNLTVQVAKTTSGTAKVYQQSYLSVVRIA